MNVPPTVHAAPASPRGRTDRDRPTGEEASSAFGQLLASASGSADEDTTAPAVDVTGAEDPEEAAPGRASAGEVADAVHAAIAAWRADPADVALGAHLREVLRATVQAGRPGASDDGRGPKGAQVIDGVGGTVDAPLPAGAPGETAAPTVHAPSDLAVAEPVTPAPASAAEAPDVAPSADGTADAPAPPGRPGTAAPATTAAPAGPPVAAAGAPDMAAAPPTTVPADRPPVSTPAGRVGAVDSRPEADRVPSDAPRAASAPAPAASPTAADAVAADAVARGGDTAPTPPRPAGAGVTAAATLDRVLRAVEALEHAPPPRRLAIEVEGVQLSVALRGDEVSVAVRGGADQLPPGWQRDLATVLRGRGLDLASGGEPGDGQGQPARDGTPGRPDHLPGRRPTDPRPGPPLESRPADAAGLRL